MKQKLKKWAKNPIILVFLVILLFYTPTAIFSPGESRNRGVITAVGLDKVDNLYEISLLTFIPTVNQSFEEQKSLISAKGESVAEAVYRAEIAMGRKIGLFHAKTTIVNEELLKEDVAKHLDYLSRVASLPENTVFVGTNKTAKELLKKSQVSKNNVGLKLEQIVAFNTENLYFMDTSLESFYEGYYNDTKSSVIGYFCLEDLKETDASVEKVSMSEDRGSIGQSANQGSEKESSQTEGEKKEELINCGKTILLKEGKLQEILSYEDLNDINLLNPKAKNQLIKIENVEQDGKKVNAIYQVKQKQILSTTKFENGYPVYFAKMIFLFELVEVEGVDEEIRVNTDLLEFTDEVKEKLDFEIKKRLSNAIDILKRNGTDILGLNKKFYLDNRKEYTNYIKNHDGVENFIKDIIFKVNIMSEPD